MNKVNVTINDNKYSFKSGITLYDISKKFKSLFVLPIIGALVNGEVKELSDTILSDCNISFFDRNTKEVVLFLYLFMLLESCMVKMLVLRCVILLVREEELRLILILRKVI